jgi:hypothetical protein
MSTLVFHSLFNHLKTSNKENGFQCVVLLGHTVRVKVWIHFFIGDTEGNNKWLGQYPGNREGVRQPYRDCKCQSHDLSNPNPNCTYLTMVNISFAKKRKQEEKMLELNITAQFPCMTLEMHLLK